MLYVCLFALRVCLLHYAILTLNLHIWKSSLTQFSCLPFQSGGAEQIEQLFRMLHNLATRHFILLHRWFWSSDAVRWKSIVFFVADFSSVIANSGCKPKMKHSHSNSVCSIKFAHQQRPELDERNEEEKLGKENRGFEEIYAFFTTRKIYLKWNWNGMQIKTSEQGK
jgi:hypothetical protein